MEVVYRMVFPMKKICWWFCWENVFESWAKTFTPGLSTKIHHSQQISNFGSCSLKSQCIREILILTFVRVLFMKQSQNHRHTIKYHKLTNYEQRTVFPSIYFARCIVIMSIFSPIFHTNFSSSPPSGVVEALSVLDNCRVLSSYNHGRFGGGTLFPLLIHYNQPKRYIPTHVQCT